MCDCDERVFSAQVGDRWEGWERWYFGYDDPSVETQVPRAAPAVEAPRVQAMLPHGREAALH